MVTVLKVMLVLKIVLLVVVACVVGILVVPFIFKSCVVLLLALGVLGCFNVKSKRPSKVEAIDQKGKTKRFNNK